MLMNNNCTFKVKTSSKLYRFYAELATWPLYEDITPFTYGSQGRFKQIDTFRDICTFLRVNFKYLILTIILLFLLGVLSYGLIIFPLLALAQFCFTSLNIFDDLETVYKGVTLLTVEFSLIVGFFGCHKLTEFLYNRRELILKNKQELPSEPKQPNIFIQAIKDKHDKICRQIEVIDE